MPFAIKIYDQIKRPAAFKIKTVVKFCRQTRFVEFFCNRLRLNLKTLLSERQIKLRRVKSELRRGRKIQRQTLNMPVIVDRSADMNLRIVVINCAVIHYVIFNIAVRGGKLQKIPRNKIRKIADFTRQKC